MILKVKVKALFSLKWISKLLPLNSTHKLLVISQRSVVNWKRGSRSTVRAGCADSRINDLSRENSVTSNNQGYVYVLANSAMPGLVKVGRTTRTASERAQELSSVSGLPTPFIVVYEQLFEDCSAAESHLHTLLAGRGFRVSENREFFNAPVNEVVRAILLTPGAITGEAIATQSGSDASADQHTYPWEAALREAVCYLMGLGDYIKDEDEALRHFQTAAKLGSLETYSILGEYYEEQAKQISEDSLEDEDSDEYREPDYDKAFSYYKEGSKKGSAYCYWRMGLLYWKDVELENATKCFSMFAKTFQSKSEFGQPAIVVDWSTLDNELHEYLTDSFADFVMHKLIPQSLNPLFLYRKEELIALSQKTLENDEDYGFGEEVVQHLHSSNNKVIEFLNGIESS